MFYLKPVGGTQPLPYPPVLKHIKLHWQHFILRLNLSSDCCSYVSFLVLLNAKKLALRADTVHERAPQMMMRNANFS